MNAPAETRFILHVAAAGNSTDASSVVAMSRRATAAATLDHIVRCVNEHDTLTARVAELDAALREIVMAHLEHRTISGDAWDAACGAIAPKVSS